MERHAVVVIGGGPAGAVTAARLAQLGHAPLLLERARFPRFHLGESLLPQSTPVLAELGLLDALTARFQVKRGAHFHDVVRARSARFGFDRSTASAPPAFQVPRDEFDELLLRHAASLGAEVREAWSAVRTVSEGGRVVGVDARGPDGVTHRIACEILVDATGRDALVARGGDGPGVARLGLEKTALYTHFRGGFRDEGDRAGDVQIVIWPAGWMWVIPFRDGRTSVGAVVSNEWLRAALVGASVEAVLERTLVESGTRARFLEGAEQLFPAATAADFSFVAGATFGPGWLAVGDAAGFLDPLFSTGAHLAIYGGFKAAGAIDAALAAGDTSPARFGAWAAELQRGADLFLGSVQAFYAGALGDLLFAEKQHPFLTNAITRMLTGDVFDADARWAQAMRARFPARRPPGEVA